MDVEGTEQAQKGNLTPVKGRQELALSGGFGLLSARSVSGRGAASCSSGIRRTTRIDLLGLWVLKRRRILPPRFISRCSIFLPFFGGQAQATDPVSNLLSHIRKLSVKCSPHPRPPRSVQPPQSLPRAPLRAPAALPPPAAIPDGRGSIARRSPPGRIGLGARRRGLAGRKRRRLLGPARPGSARLGPGGGRHGLKGP